MKLYIHDRPIILASSSSSRRMMLEQAGINITIIPAHIDETAVRNSCISARISVTETAELLAETKAKRIAMSHPDDYVIGSDQMLMVKIEGREVWLDKPVDRDQAMEHLMMLSGRSHRLISSAVLFFEGQRIWHHTEQAEITFRPFDEDFVVTYLDQAGPDILQSVGCYHIEGMGAHLCQQVRGDHFVIRGMPLLPLLAFLRARGVIET